MFVREWRFFGASATTWGCSPCFIGSHLPRCIHRLQLLTQVSVLAGSATLQYDEDIPSAAEPAGPLSFPLLTAILLWPALCLQYDDDMPSAAELAGAKVKHSAEELGEGETMILTLGALRCCACCAAVPVAVVLPAVLPAATCCAEYAGLGCPLYRPL